MAQTLGTRELTLTWYPPSGGTGSMPVRVTALGGGPDGPLGVGAAPAGGTPTMSVVRVGAQSRFAEATVAVDRAGPWEIVLDDGTTRARVPLLVVVPETAGWVWAVRGGSAGALLGLLAAAALARRRPVLATAGGGLALVGIAVAVTAALLAPSAPTVAAGGGAVPAAPEPGHTMDEAMGAGGMDMGGMEMTGTGAGDTGGAHGPGPVLMTAAASAAPGGATALALAVRDGATGSVVDDLAIHDDALIHLAVVGPRGRLWHVHPVRTGPGRYAVLLPDTEAGGYGVFAELERSAGGPQLARTAFALGPLPAVVAPTPSGATVQDVAGMRVEVSTPSPVAGRPTDVRLRFTAAGAPVDDLQSWLGMAGHLLILGPPPGGTEPDPINPAGVFAHAHAMSTAARPGPEVAFTYTFPHAGRYRLWAQVQRDWEIVTVPVTVDVATPLA